MNMYVSNLGFNVNEDELRKLFEAFGNVASAKVITDRETGRSRGFGFVEMSDEDASKAMEALNDKQIAGRAISITRAREKDKFNDRKRW